MPDAEGNYQIRKHFLSHRSFIYNIWKLLNILDKTNEMPQIFHNMENGFKNHGISEENWKTEFHGNVIFFFMQKISK